MDNRKTFLAAAFAAIASREVSPKPPNLTPISRALARGLAAASQFALCAHPTRRLRRGRIPAPQNYICCAPFIRVSLSDACRL